MSVSARSALKSGAGDALYWASKAGVCLLTESVDAENGAVRANAVLPSIVDTPMNRGMPPGADYAMRVDSAEIARVVLFLCSDAATPTSAAVPVYGEAWVSQVDHRASAWAVRLWLSPPDGPDHRDRDHEQPAQKEREAGNNGVGARGLSSERGQVGRIDRERRLVG